MAYTNPAEAVLITVLAATIDEPPMDFLLDSPTPTPAPTAELTMSATTITVATVTERRGRPRPSGVDELLERVEVGFSEFATASGGVSL